MAPLRYTAKFDPFLSLDCAPTPSSLAQSKERKRSNFAILQPSLEVELHDQLRVVVLSPTPDVRSVFQRYLIPLGINSIDFLSLIYEK